MCVCDPLFPPLHRITRAHSNIHKINIGPLMIPLTSPETEKLAQVLSKYSPLATISRLAGLLTVPSLQANTIRVEFLVHLAVTYCTGKKIPGYLDLRCWINKYLGKTRIFIDEDPVEDVFVTNVRTPEGNRRVFEGIWESNDYFLQALIDTLLSENAPKVCRDLLQPAFALLRLSDFVAERLRLQRWHIETSVPQRDVQIPSMTVIKNHAFAVNFTDDDLVSLGVNREALSNFIFFNDDKEKLKTESTGHSSLELRPLVDFGDTLVLALPHAVSPAIRRFVLSELQKMGYLQTFSNALAKYQAYQVEEDGLRELKNNTVSLSPPPHDNELMPPLSTWLLKYDTNKYIHVVFLHGQLDKLNKEGLSSIMEYPELLRTGLEKYLSKVALHCKALPDFVEGMTLIVTGGLGGGLMLGFTDGPADDWRLSFIRVSDILMLAGDIEQPIKRYLKCIKQKEWAENQGVSFMNINGDFNFYCYWRNLNYQLISQKLSVDGSSMIAIWHDFVLPVRQKLRNLVDRHSIQTVTGQFVQVIRFGLDAYFKSMQGRPIYVSLGHIQAGILAGAVESSRGPTWLIIEPREGDRMVRHLRYQIWNGFLGLFDRLVTETEVLLPHLATGAIEIRLDFRELEVPTEFVPTVDGILITEPDVIVHPDQRIAKIKFPCNFLTLFQQPNNTGEKFVLRAIAKGLVSLHQNQHSIGDVGKSLIETLLGKVIDDSGMRVLHLFHSPYPFERLLKQNSQVPVFLSHEDYIFSKLRLSEGCTEVKSEAVLETKEKCNNFLHKVVEKLIGQIRCLLHPFDRASVIRQVLAIHEAVIQDRDHWRQTAQAIIALYKDDVYSVATKREGDIVQVAFSARAILEMAVCECQASDGRKLSQWDLDDLLAKMFLLIEVATDSDAINYDLVEPKIQLHLNGEYTIDRSFHGTVIRPFISNYFREQFDDAADDYSKLYQRERPAERKRAADMYSVDFNNAFKTEFGLTPDNAIDGFAELMDLAVEQNNVIVQTSIGELQNRLIRVRGMSSESCQSFLKTFGIFHRPKWKQPPLDFNERDLYPWRFVRRLSATARPLLIFGGKDSDVVFYGAGTLPFTFDYILGRSKEGLLPGRFFKTDEMKKYIGAVNDKKGHAFAKSIAEKLRQQGWQVRNEVKMTELGAPKISADGDIDVLAWKPNGEVQLIECKRLQLARTVAEMAETCRRFKGEANDELNKHVKRVNWVIQNPSSLERITGFIPGHNAIDARLVTNTHVPMMYLKSLPIPSDKIGPLI